MATNTLTPIIVTLDTETIGLDGALKRIAIYDGESITYGYRFPDIEWKLEEWNQRGFLPHIYIHNFDFDGRKLPEIFRRGNVRWNRTKKINNRYVRLVCKNYTIHDSFNILPFSLAKLSKDFDLTHGKLDLWKEVEKLYPGSYTDKGDYFARCPADEPLYIEYLGYDVLSLYELITKLMEIAKLETENFVRILSTASLSRYLFKNGYGGEQFMTGEKTDFERLTSCKAWSSEKIMKHANITYAQCELKMRAGFYGGRTEVFTPVCEPTGGNISAYHYDVNSLYPSVMINNDFPIGYPDYFTGDFCRLKWKEWLEDRNGLGFITATVYVPPQFIPPLPSKIGKLVFLTGWQRGTWTYVELAYAVEHCGVEVHEVHEMIHFPQVHKVFHNFVSEFYKLKERGTVEKNNSLRSFAKLILNTAYGWTVLRRDDKTCLRDIDMLEKWKDKDRHILYVNEALGMFEMEDKVLTDTIQVQIGAYVTSYARLVLLDALRKQSDKGTVYYCDTDSVVCSAPMADEIVDGVKLGYWGLESRLLSGMFLQPKVYTEHKAEEARDTIKFKGITRERQAELDADFYRDILNKLRAGYTDKIIIEYARKSLPSLAVAQKQGIDPNRFKVMDKGLNLGAKPKREINYTANTSRAWHMDSIEKFDRFNFKTFDNPPDGNNLFGG